MAKVQSSGTCAACGAAKPKSAMSRHLTACERRATGDEERVALVVEGAREPEYWLHLEVKPEATLRDLDGFLRDLWLECCGHLSEFDFGRQRRYAVDAGEDDFEPGAEGMDVAVGEVFGPGATAKYTYDFGSSTELFVRALAPRRGPASREPVRLAARNLPPALKCRRGHPEPRDLCSACHEPVCAKCARSHPCGEEMLLPIVNSPRAGTCAYGA